MKNTIKKVVVIPARLTSARLPNKVILDLGGKPIVQRVFEQALQAANISAVYIATDSEEIKGICTRFTENVILTSPNHQSGTDRIAEAITHIEADIIINVQGDEPFIDPGIIERLAERLSGSSMDMAPMDMATIISRIEKVEDFLNPNIVKVVVNERGNAMYFSRSPLPFPRDVDLKHATTLPADFKAYRHFGIYGYKRDFLRQYAKLSQTYLEKTEKLEQLRVLEQGYSIGVLETDQPGLGIDTPEDLEKARQMAAQFYTEVEK